MKNISLFLGILCLAGTTAAQSNQQPDSTPPAQGWVQLTSGITSSTLGCISLIGRDTIYVAGIGNPPLMRSTDAGVTWQQPMYALNLGDGGYVQFFDANYGFLCGAVDKIFRTTNAGVTWDSASTGLVGGLGIGPGRGGLVTFCSRKNGCVMSGSNINFTSDSSRTWHPASCPGGNYNCMFLADSLRGYAMGGAVGWLPDVTKPHAAAFERTTDGGATWNLQYAGPPDNRTHSGVTRDVLGIAAINADTLFAVGLQIARSFNAGTDWDTVAYPGDDGFNAFFAVSFPDPLHGTAVGSNGWIYRTADAGNTWSPQNSGITDGSILYAVAFSDSLTGYACGDNGIILKTSNGGLSWVNLSPGMDSVQGSVYPNPANSSTTLSYSIPLAQHVNLALLDLSGNIEENLVTGTLQEGWQTVEVDTSKLPSGTYMYSLNSEIYHTSGKIEVIH